MGTNNNQGETGSYESRRSESSDDVAENDAAPKDDTTLDESFVTKDLLRRVMPGVPDMFLEFFEPVYSNGLFHPVIKSAEQLFEERGLDPGRLRSMTLAATNARIQDDHLPPRRRSVAHFDAVYRVQRSLKHSLSGWPISVIDVLLRDPIHDKVDHFDGLDMLSTRYGFVYDIGEQEHQPIRLGIDDLHQGVKMARDDFDNDMSVGLGPSYGSNTEQLDRRLKHFYLVMNPRNPQLQRAHQ